MKMIVAYIRPIVQDQVVERLRKMEVPGASLSQVRGFGLEADTGGEGSYGPQVSPYTETVKLEVACPDVRADELAEGLADAARTGRRGDGKVFILPVHRSIDIRTHESSDEPQTSM